MASVMASPPELRSPVHSSGCRNQRPATWLKDHATSALVFRSSYREWGPVVGTVAGHSAGCAARNPRAPRAGAKDGPFLALPDRSACRDAALRDAFLRRCRCHWSRRPRTRKRSASRQCPSLTNDRNHPDAAPHRQPSFRTPPFALTVRNPDSGSNQVQNDDPRVFPETARRPPVSRRIATVHRAWLDGIFSRPCHVRRLPVPPPLTNHAPSAGKSTTAPTMLTRNMNVSTVPMSA